MDSQKYFCSGLISLRLDFLRFVNSINMVIFAYFLKTVLFVTMIHTANESKKERGKVESKIFILVNGESSCISQNERN